MMSPVKSVANYPAMMAQAMASSERVFEVLDLPADEGDRPGEIQARFKERIEYRNVSFAYPGGSEVLHDVGLVPGQEQDPLKRPRSDEDIRKAQKAVRQELPRPVTSISCL